jgi:hypothetical protein
MDVSGLTSGVYLLKIKHEEGNAFRTIVVKP